MPLAYWRISDGFMPARRAMSVTLRNEKYSKNDCKSYLYSNSTALDKVCARVFQTYLQIVLCGLYGIARAVEPAAIYISLCVTPKRAITRL